MRDLEEWLRSERETTLAELVERGDGCVALDAALADYAQWMWEHDKSQGALAETLNAVKLRHRQVGGKLTGAWAVRTAWALCEPGENRTPLPPTLVRALAALALIWGWPSIAALLMVGFEGSMRPSDLLGLERRDLRFASEHGEPEPGFYVVFRHAKTAQTRGARWQHVRIHAELVLALAWSVWGTLPPNAPLFHYPGSARARGSKLAAYVSALFAALEVPWGAREGFTLGGLRAGGTTAVLRHTGSLEVTRWRGRWDSARSMEHYVQELAMGSAYASLPDRVRAQLGALSRLLPTLIHEQAGSTALTSP